MGEFNIKFMPRIAIKGQAVADFVAEFSYPTRVFKGENTTPSTLEK